MKKSSLLALALLAAAFLSVPARAGYLINAKIAGLPDGPIKIHAIFDAAVLAETTAKNGAFTIKHDGDFVGHHVYLAGAGLTRPDFYLEPGTITLERSASGTIVASGTISNDAHNAYLREIAPTEKRMTEIRVRLR